MTQGALVLPGAAMAICAIYSGGDPTWSGPNWAAASAESRPHGKRTLQRLLRLRQPIHAGQRHAHQVPGFRIAGVVARPLDGQRLQFRPSVVTLQQRRLQEPGLVDEGPLPVGYMARATRAAAIVVKFVDGRIDHRPQPFGRRGEIVRLTATQAEGQDAHQSKLFVEQPAAAGARAEPVRTADHATAVETVQRQYLALAVLQTQASGIAKRRHRLSRLQLVGSSQRSPRWPAALKRSADTGRDRNRRAAPRPANARRLAAR